MKDWAAYIKEIADERYPEARKIRLVMDNLNTHSIASLYVTYAPDEARRLAERFEIHYTPKHGSWLNVAEIELSVLKRQCLDRRIADKEKMIEDITSWIAERNAEQHKVNWQFTSSEARIKLKRLYPVIETHV